MSNRADRTGRNAPAWNAYHRQRYASARQVVRDEYIARGSVCEECGTPHTLCAMDWVNTPWSTRRARKDGTPYGIAQLCRLGPEAVSQELRNCVLLCRDCWPEGKTSKA